MQFPSPFLLWRLERGISGLCRCAPSVPGRILARGLVGHTSTTASCESRPGLVPWTLESISMPTKGAHVRLEEPVREGAASGTSGEPPASGHAVALGVCVRDISVGPDSRASEGRGGDVTGGRLFGRKFRKMETGLLGNFCECRIGAQGVLCGGLRLRVVRNVVAPSGFCTGKF